uniref:Permease n=1 Tax=candidate division WOR-3 bacterium TaxID=2052148 RepID=A0A7C2K0D1_UNCW3
MSFLLKLFEGGLHAIIDYIAKHTITCLVPAFFLAGAMVTFINKNKVLQFLGSTSHRALAYIFAVVGSFLIAACSCTVIPVASGLYFAGATIGVSFIILWVAPAANVLALAYTGSILGAKMAGVRLLAAVLVAVLVGLVMDLAFGKEVRDIPQAPKHLADEPLLNLKHLILMVLVLLSLLMPNYLVRTGAYIYKVLVFLGSALVVVIYSLFTLKSDEVKTWISETWWFAKIIFPLMLLGVFIVGIVGVLLPHEVVTKLVGENNISSSFFATMFGAISYFATMTEAPFVDKLMKLGMAKGPALALLLTGPGLSLPNWIAIARIFGIKKALVYVPLVVLLGTFSGVIFGRYIL